MNQPSNKFIDAAVLLYPLLIAIFFGAVLLDVVYSHLLTVVQDAGQTSSVFRQVSDALLQLGFLSVLAAIVSISLSWQFPAARNYFIISLVLIAFEFLLPAIASPLLKQSQVVDTISPWLRILLNLAVVGAGFQALRLYFQAVYAERSNAAGS